MHEYDLIADWYATERRDDTGVPETQDLARRIPPGSRVLDIGCGNGIPISRALLTAGHAVVGLDSSRNMLIRFRANCPDSAAVRAQVQACPFADEVFDAAVAWGILFHLTRDELLAAVAGTARLLRKGGLFLFTSPDEHHEEGIQGTMHGVTFHYYAALGLDEWHLVWAEHGLELIDRHTDCGDNTYFLTRKVR
jgi:cyclopropane fatty-acyl-phospholipid synthase-like methyltransferase